MVETTRNFLNMHIEKERKAMGYLFHIAYKSDHSAMACLRSGKIKVDTRPASLRTMRSTPNGGRRSRRQTALKFSSLWTRRHFGLYTVFK